jgi:hypothetical protein
MVHGISPLAFNEGKHLALNDYGLNHPEKKISPHFAHTFKPHQIINILAPDPRFEVTTNSYIGKSIASNTRWLNFSPLR